MAKKQTSVEEPKKSPRTVQELAPWIDSQFGNVKSLIRDLANLKPAEEHFEFGSPANLEQLTHQFIGSLHQALSYFEKILLDSVSRPSTDATAYQLARALLLTGNGERYEPAVRSAIRVYADTCQEVHRFSKQSGIREELRDDILAGFARLTATQEQDLQVLGVRTEEVPPGAPLDTSTHLVVKQLETAKPEALNTVRHAITPIFRWHGAQAERIEPARVIAFTKSKGGDDQLSPRPSGDSPSSQPQVDEPTLMTGESNLF